MRIRKGIGVLLLILGIGSLLYPQLENLVFDREQEKIQAAFEQLGNLDELEIPDSSITGNDENDLVPLLDGARGMLEIDKIDLKIAIFEGTSVDALRKGSGMIEPEKQFGVNNIGIAGHRSIKHGKQFNRLNELKPGDEVTVSSKEGTFVFVITKSFVVHQSETSVLDDKEQPMLTLVTCTPIGSKHPPDRLIVQGNLKGK